MTFIQWLLLIAMVLSPAFSIGYCRLSVREERHDLSQRGNA
jgi:hypothetical protein